MSRQRTNQNWALGVEIISSGLEGCFCSQQPRVILRFPKKPFSKHSCALEQTTTLTFLFFAIVVLDKNSHGERLLPFTVPQGFPVEEFSAVAHSGRCPRGLSLDRRGYPLDKCSSYGYKKGDFGAFL